MLEEGPRRPIGHCRELCSWPMIKYLLSRLWFMSRGQSFRVYISFSVCCFKQLLLHSIDGTAPAKWTEEGVLPTGAPVRRCNRGRIFTMTSPYYGLPGCFQAGRQGSAGLVVRPCLPLQLHAQACLNKVGAFPQLVDVIRPASVDVAFPLSTLDCVLRSEHTQRDVGSCKTQTTTTSLSQFHDRLVNTIQTESDGWLPNIKDENCSWKQKYVSEKQWQPRQQTTVFIRGWSLFRCRGDGSVLQAAAFRIAFTALNNIKLF